MDDFGTGYSSLSYLQAFPFDKIKIDQAFISNLDNNPQSAAIVRAVIGLGRGLDLPVVAEGVETAEQLAFLATGILRRDPGLSDRKAAADRGVCLIHRIDQAKSVRQRLARDPPPVPAVASARPPCHRALSATRPAPDRPSSDRGLDKL